MKLCKYKQTNQVRHNTFFQLNLIKITISPIIINIFNIWTLALACVYTLITKKFGRKNFGREIIGREIFGRFFSKFRTISDKISDKISDSYIQKPAKFGQKMWKWGLKTHKNEWIGKIISCWNSQVVKSSPNFIK